MLENMQGWYYLASLFVLAMGALGVFRRSVIEVVKKPYRAMNTINEVAEKVDEMDEKVDALAQSNEDLQDGIIAIAKAQNSPNTRVEVGRVKSRLGRDSPHDDLLTDVPDSDSIQRRGNRTSGGRDDNATGN